MAFTSCGWCSAFDGPIYFGAPTLAGNHGVDSFNGGRAKTSHFATPGLAAVASLRSSFQLHWSVLAQPYLETLAYVASGFGWQRPSSGDRAGEQCKVISIFLVKITRRTASRQVTITVQAVIVGGQCQRQLGSAAAG